MLKRSSVTTALFAMFVAFGVTRAVASDPALTPIAAAIAAANASDEKKLSALFTPDAVLFDEVSPYRWFAPNAPLQWLRADGAIINKNGVKNARISVGAPRFIHRSPMSVYTVSPLVDTYEVAGQPQRETGLLTVILVKRDGVWKISLMGFAKMSDTRDASWTSP